jgi:hypothetical protein
MVWNEVTPPVFDSIKEGPAWSESCRSTHAASASATKWSRGACSSRRESAVWHSGT